MSTKIQAIIENRLQTKKGSKFSFKNLATGEEGKAITFGDFDASWLGERVEFEADYNEKFKNYNIKGDILLLDGIPETSQADNAVPSVPATETKPVVRRGRPKRDTKVSVKSNDAGSGREAYRSEAEQGALLNLQSAQRVATSLGFSDVSVGDLVALADIIGRTQTAIFMDVKKDSRMKGFRK